MALDQGIFKLKGVVQHYSWGGYDFIPRLLGIDNSEQKPYAEYWMGAHGNHSAFIENGNKISLSDFIARDAEGVLGSSVAKKFSSLPYLLKVLDVRQMLSIQVHPSKEAAKINFEEENKKGIPVNAPHRNYKDRNHKPELMIALSDFWLLHGFKKEEDLLKVLGTKRELKFLKEIFIQKGYKGLYEEVMLMEQKKVNEVLHPILQKIIPLYHDKSLSKDEEDFWAVRAALNFCKDDNYDRGIFSIYLFNLIHLKKGEGIFQPSGLPHAYLEGQNVEIMANSDNVLRAGLTDKYIDVLELLKHVRFEAIIPKILNPQSNYKIYSSPAEEFELQEYSLAKDEIVNIRITTGEIFLLMNGSLEIISNQKMELKEGDSIFVKAGTDMRIKPLSQINLFRATVPT
jgi:mannose-6-phosphate isomerase